MIPLDPTAVAAIVCVCLFCAVGGYLLGYLEGLLHARGEERRWWD